MGMNIQIDAEWDAILNHTQRVLAQLESADANELGLLLSERQQMVKQYFEKKPTNQLSNQPSIGILEERIRQLQHQDQKIMARCKKQQQQILEQSRKFQHQQKSAGAYNTLKALSP